MNNVETLKTEAQMASEFKTEIAESLIPACAIMDRARKAGMNITFAMATDGFGRTTVQNLTIVKPL